MPLTSSSLANLKVGSRGGWAGACIRTVTWLGLHSASTAIFNTGNRSQYSPWMDERWVVFHRCGLYAGYGILGSFIKWHHSPPPGPPGEGSEKVLRGTGSLESMERAFCASSREGAPQAMGVGETVIATVPV